MNLVDAMRRNRDTLLADLNGDGYQNRLLAVRTAGGAQLQEIILLRSSALRDLFARPGFGGVPQSAGQIQGSSATSLGSATSFGTAGLGFLARGFRLDPMVGRLNGLATYPLAS